MSPAFLFVVIALFAVANLPTLIYLIKHRRTPMPVLSQFQPIVDELTTLTAAVSALKDQASNAPAALDLTDTAAALQAAADGLKSAAGQ